MRRKRTVEEQEAAGDVKRSRGRPPKTHNNPPEEVDNSDEITETTQTIAAGQLRAFIERVERLEEEAKTIRDDIKEVYAEAKGTGFDTKILRVLIRLRKMDQAERQEQEAILDLYKAAIGMA